MKWPRWGVVCGLLIASVSLAQDPLPERIVLASHDQIWYPIEYPGPDDVFIGPWIDRLEAVFADALSVELQLTRQPWRRAQEDVRTGRADMMITLPTTERLNYSQVVDGVFYSMTFQLLVNRYHPDWDQLQTIQTLDDIQSLDLNLVSTFGNGWFEQHVVQRGIDADFVKTDRQQVQFLLSGRADGLIDFPVTMAPLLEELDPEGALVFLPPVLDTTDFRILVSEKSPWINHLDALAAALKQADALQP